MIIDLCPSCQRAYKPLSDGSCAYCGHDIKHSKEHFHSETQYLSGKARDYITMALASMEQTLKYTPPGKEHNLLADLRISMQSAQSDMEKVASRLNYED